MSATQGLPAASGFAVGYGKGKGAFRVYLCLVLAAGFAGLWWWRGSEIALALAVLFALTSYYFYPLIEAWKVRLGAGEHGIFIEGFGIIPWRTIDKIELTTTAVRSIEINQLKITLNKNLPQALIADWRSLPYHRLLMKLPWSMDSDGIIRVNLEPFAGNPAEIVAAIERNQRYFGG